MGLWGGLTFESHLCMNIWCGFVLHRGIVARACPPPRAVVGWACPPHVVAGGLSTSGVLPVPKDVGLILV